MIRVTLLKRSGRKFFEARWRDPITEKKKTRSTRETVRRDAERFAARLEDDLNGGQSRTLQKATWKEATEIFASEVFPSEAATTSNKMRITWRLVEKLIDPATMASVQEGEIGKLIVDLQKKKRSPFTIKAYLSKLNVFFEWGLARRYLLRLPSTEASLQTVPPNRGRAITREEFDRMLKATRKVVGKARAKKWRRMLIGLWLSGLRLREGSILDWTDDDKLRVDFSGKRPMLRIQASDDKARSFRLLPMTPDFYRFLQRTPPKDRHGPVFSPEGERSERLGVGEISKTISAIGKAAGIKASKSARGVKYASAHDLRRAFGFRWSRRVRAPILMQLMRHRHITTTMQFYIRQDAEAAADEVWRSLGNTFGNSAHSDRPPAGRKHQENTRNSE